MPQLDLTWFMVKFVFAWMALMLVSAIIFKMTRDTLFNPKSKTPKIKLKKYKWTW